VIEHTNNGSVDSWEKFNGYTGSKALEVNDAYRNGIVLEVEDTTLKPLPPL